MVDTTATIETFITQLVGVAALGLAAWLGLSLLLWTVVIPRPNHLLGRLTTLTMPGTRRVAQLLLAAGIAACSPSTTADTPTLVWVSDAEPSTSTTLLSTGRPSTTQRPPTSPQSSTSLVASSSLPPTTAPMAEPPPSEAPPTEPQNTGPSIDAGPPMDTEQAPAAEFHIVAQGENFWSIAAETVGTRRERAGTNTEIADYWRQLIELNRASLFSGEPDLIYPGETLRLAAE